MTDVAVPPGPAGRSWRSCSKDKVSAGGRRVAAFAVGAVQAPEVPERPGLAGQPGPPARRRAASSPRCRSGHREARGQGRRLRHRACSRRRRPPTSKRSRTSCSASPARRGYPALRIRPDRPRPALVGPPRGGGRPALRARCARRPGAWSGTWCRRAAARHRRARWTGWSSRPPRPAAGGWPGCGPGRRSTRPSGRSWTATLSRLAGSPVELQVTVDPALLAGVKVQIGDLQVDGTARGRLERLREHVVQGGWQDKGSAGWSARPTPTRRRTAAGARDEQRGSELMAELTIDAQRDHRGAAAPRRRVRAGGGCRADRSGRRGRRRHRPGLGAARARR